METRANYVLIGVFTVLSLLGGLGFLLWLAQFELDRQFSYYDILFDNVSGLSRGGEVRYNGVAVGQVVSFSLNEDDPSLIRIRIEVQSNTPITTATEARLALQGVTGVSYVALTNRDSSAPLLSEVSEEDVPIIRGSPSTFDVLIEEAPDILTETLSLLKELGEFVGPENQEAVAQILTNVAGATGRLDEALDDFSQVSEQIRNATQVLASFTEELGPLTDEVRRVAVATEGAMSAAESALTAAASAIGEAESLLETEVRDLVARADDTLAVISEGTDTVAASIRATAAVAVARLEQAEVAIARGAAALEGGTEMLAAVRDAAEAVGSLTAGEGTAFVVEARDAAAMAAERLRQLEPALAQATVALTEGAETLAVTRRAAASVDALVTGEGAAMVAEGRAAAAAAAARLQQLETSIAKADATLDQGTVTLRAIEDTATTADTLLAGDGAALVAEARRALTAANEVLAGLEVVAAEDLPRIIADVRSAATTVNTVATQVGEEINRIGPNVSDFTGRLPGLAVQAEGAIVAATETFRSANESLGAVEGTLATADRTLVAAEQTFTGANQVINEDLDGILGDLRRVATSLQTAIDDVTADLPEIAAELREAMENANAAMALVEASVADAAPAVRNFARSGLPQFNRLAQEARALVASLERLTARIERDPARFFLGSPSEFRR